MVEDGRIHPTSKKYRSPGNASQHKTYGGLFFFFFKVKLMGAYSIKLYTRNESLSKQTEIKETDYLWFMISIMHQTLTSKLTRPNHSPVHRFHQYAIGGRDVDWCQSSTDDALGHGKQYIA